MPCCTYIDESEAVKLRSSDDPDIDEALKEVRERTGDDWLVEKRVIESGWLRKKYRTVFYLYHHVSGPEYQIINFAPDEPGVGSINIRTGRSNVLAYFYGLLAKANRYEDLIYKQPAEGHGKE